MKLRGISRNVIVLGWVSFCTDLASEMLYPIMPLFLVGSLGSAPWMLGLIDGLAEGISSGLRWIGGALSDRYAMRRPFVFMGYLISAVSKPIMGLSALFMGWPLFLAGRCTDRLGKSVRTAARDALIADSTEAEHRGAAFGFHRAMDTAGAVIGPLAALGVIGAMVGFGAAFWAPWKSDAGAPSHQQISGLPLHWLFLLAVVPGLISALLVLTHVREIAPPLAGEGKPPSLFQRYPAALWHLLAANALFSLGNSSDSFLILRASQNGMAFGPIILAFALYNAVYALASGPLGWASDRLGRKPVIISGWIVYAAVYLGFALFRAPGTPWLLFAMYGLYQAFTEGVTKAMVSDLVPSEQRAGAIGLFYTVSGFGQLVASVTAGLLWDSHVLGLFAPFALGAAMALVAVTVIASVPLPNRNPTPVNTA